MEKSIREQTADWRKLLQGVARRLDKPLRLDSEWTRGRYGVGYDPLPSGNCSKHIVFDREGKYSYTIRDPFCLMCYPNARRGVRHYLG